MRMAKKQDEMLMIDLAEGNRDCLEPLVRRYATPLLTFIRRMVGDHHQSEELFQEVFLSVWQKRKQYQHWRPFKPWFYAIAVNKVRAYLRDHAPVATISLDYDPPLSPVGSDPPPGDSLVATETSSMVATAVGRLPVKQQIVVVLRLWSGFSYGEIAEILERNEGTVRSHMHHALATLRDYLEPRMR